MALTSPAHWAPPTTIFLWESLTNQKIPIWAHSKSYYMPRVTNCPTHRAPPTTRYNNLFTASGNVPWIKKYQCCFENICTHALNVHKIIFYEISHLMIEQSLEPVKAYLSSGVRHRTVTVKRWPLRNLIESPLSTGAINYNNKKIL